MLMLNESYRLLKKAHEANPHRNYASTSKGGRNGMRVGIVADGTCKLAYEVFVPATIRGQHCETLADLVVMEVAAPIDFEQVDDATKFEMSGKLRTHL